jgi:hypothetical protein
LKQKNKKQELGFDHISSIDGGDLIYDADDKDVLEALKNHDA